MVDVGIVRSPTEQEAVNFVKLRNRTPWEDFLAKLSVVEQKFAKLHEPFDGQCAKLDFKDTMAAVQRESERKHGFVYDKDLYAVIETMDLESYANKKLFDYLGEDEDAQDRIVDGMRMQVCIGHTLKFRCKKRGHGVSVFIPKAEYDERFAKNKKEE